MSEEHDSWFKEAFGVDLGQAADKIKEQASAAFDQAKEQVTQVVQTVETTVEGGLDRVVKGAAGVVTGAAGAVKKAAAAAMPSASSGAGSAGSGTGSFPLGGSVGRGGKNAANDVRAVQGALGIAVDGKCGGGTIAAIEAFQRNMGLGKADGRVDVGGGTERALAKGARGASAEAPAPEPAKGDDDSGSFFDRAVEGAKDLGGKVITEVGDDFDAARAFGGGVLKGAGDLSGGGGSALDDSGGSGSPLSAPIESLLGIGVGGQFSLPSLTALPPDPGFPVGAVAFGQFAAKLSGKFKPTLLSSIKAPKPAEAELGIKAICKELYENASFNWFGGLKVKGDKKSAGAAASFLKVSTKVGDVTLDISAFDIGLDLKKLVKASVGSTSASFPVFERELNGVKYEIDLSIGGALEISPNPLFIEEIVAAGGEATVGSAIFVAIDVALVAGPPLAAAAVIGIGIFMAGEKADRDAAILEGAVDAHKAAFDYAFTMTGNEASPVGPRAKAAVAVATTQLAKVAASQKISLEVLKRELALANTKNRDILRIHAQARQQIFAAYFARVRSHLKEWRKEHSVLAAFTTEADDIIAVDKMVAIIFEKP